MRSKVNSPYNIVLIGAGNVAYHLGCALHKVGHRILQVFSRTEENAQKLARKVNAKFTADLKFILQNADIYLICVSDTALSDINENLLVKDSIVAHVSGSSPMRILAKTSSNFGVFYPFQTFSAERAIRFKDIPICIEASSNHVEETLFKLAHSLGSKPQNMDSETRKWLHLAGVFSCNFVNHMLALSYLVTEHKGVDFELLKPLLTETIRKGAQDNPFKVQTGPAIRGDMNTIVKHVAMLGNISDDIASLYISISASIWNMKDQGSRIKDQGSRIKDKG